MATFRAAKTIWDLCNGKVSNLAMQKLLYLSHMLELGAGRPSLVDRPFEAWDYGPVEKDLYQRLKAYGSGYVEDVFFENPYLELDPEYQSISEVVDQLGNARPGLLVSITHWPEGAWSKHYIPNSRGITIPNYDILKEFNDRQQRVADKQPA